ncbi:hypothetical protein [Sphingomonas sp. PAMC 26621]|uniref:hypothetical protein n=1 Tax=Sphingomonas sp. PAMC 26621 TaxID=1112213 RepID=UPI0002891E42
MVLVGSVGISGCATKGYVNQQIATVNSRIDTIDGRVRTVEGTSGQALTQAQAAAGQAQQNAQRSTRSTAASMVLTSRCSSRRSVSSVGRAVKLSVANRLH